MHNSTTSIHKRRKYYDDHMISSLGKGLKGVIGVWHWNGFKALVLVSLLILSSITLQEAYAVSQITWGLISAPVAGYPIDRGFIGDLEEATFEVEDTAFNGGGLATISVTITSSVDPVGTALTLTEQLANNGRFKATVVFTEALAVFQVSDTATIRIQDNCDPGSPSGGTTGNCNPLVIETLTGGVDGATVKSQTDTAGVPVHLTETGPNTGIFEGKLKFTSSGSSTSAPFPGLSILRVTPGDTISVMDDLALDFTNGFISSSTSNKGAIRVANGGTVTASYPAGSNFHTINIAGPASGGAGGRGGGGLVAPGLVVDAIASSISSGNGCKGDCSPPTLGVDDTYKRLVNSGFSYNDQPVDVELYYTHYPLVTVNVGQENKATLRIYDNSGPQNIEHVGLAFGLGKGEIFAESKATLALERNTNGEFTISENDPENVLDNIHIQTAQDRCSPFVSAQCLIVTIFHTFRAPLDFNMVSTQVWDSDRNEWQNYYNDGVEVDGKSLNPPKQHIGIYKGHQITITETDKNKAIDDSGRTWTFDNEWIMDYIQLKKLDKEPTSHGYERDHVKFATYKKEQEAIANQIMSEILAGKTIQKTFDDEPRNHEFNYVSRAEDQDLQQRIIDEIIRAERAIQTLYYYQ